MIIFIVGGAILLKRPPKDDSDVPKLSTYNNTNEEIDTQGGTSYDMLISGEAQAKKIFAKYATSKSMDDIFDIIYLRSKNENLISKKWEQLNIGSGWKAEENFIWIVTEAEDSEYGILSGTLPNFSRFNAVFRIEGGAMKLEGTSKNSRIIDFQRIMAL